MKKYKKKPKNGKAKKAWEKLSEYGTIEYIYYDTTMRVWIGNVNHLRIGVLV